MLVEKEVIAPGTYFYLDKEGQPRKLDVTPEDTRYWCNQGMAMIGAGLSVPVPYEHDFDQHPMTPKDKLLNNAGGVKEYKLKSFTDPIRGEVKDALFSVVEVKDSKVREKIKEGSIQWTSPWFNSFVDGNGKEWKNVISHLALTTRPRVTAQQPFDLKAALSMAAHTPVRDSLSDFCLSRAGLLLKDKPAYDLAFSLYTGVALAFPPPKKDKGKPPADKKPTSQGGKPDENPTPSEGQSKPGASSPQEGGDDPSQGEEGSNIDLPPLGDKAGDVSMEEVLCDLLRALGVDVQHDGDEQQFKRNLYAGAMKKVHDLTNKGMNKDQEKPGAINAGKPPGSPGAPNPLVQQEQQPMYMGIDMSAPALSLEDIQKIEDPTMRTIALSLHTQNTQLLAAVETATKAANTYRDNELKKATATRAQRVAILSKLAPKAKEGLESMLANPGMALSMDTTGGIVDPMATTLDILEKSLGSIPILLTTPSSALSIVPHPTDASEMSKEEEDKLADDMARKMGAPPEKKSA